MVTEMKMIKNTLEDPTSNIHRVEYENNYYIIKIIYNGDYSYDKVRNDVKKENIKILSKSKDPLYTHHP